LVFRVFIFNGVYFFRGRLKYIADLLMSKEISPVEYRGMVM